MDREPHEARFCAECNKRHSAEEGDLWAESSMLGLKITYFAFMDGKVYDITGIWNITQLTSLVYTGSYPASDLYWEVRIFPVKMSTGTSPEIRFLTQEVENPV